uniref:CCDC92/74 N-terminal domain-containing protein n=1 Tax=Caenorhabditis japonica TaxID=281687 RepID=A0A8R1E3M3_CAEJA
MSTAVVITRPSSQTNSFSSSTSTRCSLPSSSLESIKTATKPLEFRELDHRIEEALRERDEQWRRHEKAQIQFLQTESANMLQSLHAEINRLSNVLREEKRRSANTDEAAEKIELLEKLIGEKEEYTKGLERKVTSTIQKLQEQITIQSERIRQLNEELNDRNQTVTHLSQQLRAIKLREAMATSTHRRRASQQNSPPVTSPSSPHRIFPPISSGLVSASVAVTYPGGGRLSVQKRSNSAMRAPTMPN